MGPWHGTAQPATADAGAHASPCTGSPARRFSANNLRLLMSLRIHFGYTDYCSCLTIRSGHAVSWLLNRFENIPLKMQSQTSDVHTTKTRGEVRHSRRDRHNLPQPTEGGLFLWAYSYLNKSRIIRASLPVCGTTLSQTKNFHISTGRQRFSSAFRNFLTPT